MPDAFVSPSEAQGQFDPKALNGRLILFTPQEYVEHITTAFNPDKDAVRVSYVVLDGPDTPESVEGAFVWQGALIGALKGRVGAGMVLGRLGQRPPSKPGMSPAWVLNDPTDEDKQIARRYLVNTAIA